MKEAIKIKCVLVLVIVLYSSSCIFSQTNFIWGKQFGSSKDEVAFNVAADPEGNIFIAGYTSGALDGQNKGGADGFISKLDSVGNLIWTKQIGSDKDDIINWICIDKSGCVYVTGATRGILNERNFGKEDILVAKLDNTGNLKWQKQFGSDSTDVGNVIYADDRGDVYIAGATKGLIGGSQFGKADCFILKLDSDGNKIYANQFGTPEGDECRGLTKDADSNIYVCGNTWGDLACKNKGYNDAFVAVFKDNGEQIKLIQFGTNSYDGASCLKVDKDKNIYVGGSTGGDLAEKQLGEGDAFLTKINLQGEFLWTKQFGTKRWDGILGIDLKENVSDNIVVSGCQRWPECQSFCKMFSKNGDQLWVRNSTATGKNGGTCGKGVCLTDTGYVLHTGQTGANLFNSTAGEHDIFIYKLELDKGSTKK